MTDVALSILIPFQSNDPWRRNIFKLIKERWEKLYPAAEVVIGTDDSIPFSRSKARNNAAEKATGLVYCFADADTVCNKVFLDAARHGSYSSRWVFPYRVYYNLTEPATETVIEKLRQNPACDLARPEVGHCEYVIPSISGIYFMRRESFERVGGYDEAFVGWGYEDDAFRIAADAILGPHGSVPLSWCAHLWHEAPESVRFDQPHIEANLQRLKKYQSAAGHPQRIGELNR